MTTTITNLESDRAQVSKAVEIALDVAKKEGATAAAAGASLDSGLSITSRMGDVETLEHHRGQSLSVTVYQGQRKGSASSSALSADAIKEAVEAAVRIARYTSEDPCAGLADADLMASEIPDLDLFHPWPLQADEAIEITKACEAAALSSDKRIVNSEGSSLNTFQGTSAYANSHGFLGVTSSSRHSLSCSVIAEDKSGMQRDYWYTSSRLSAQLESPESVGLKSAERALARLSPQKLSTRKTPVLFSAELAKGLMGHLVGAVSGGALYRKASFLLDAVGEKILPEFVHIYEDPLIPQAPGSAAFDAEGVATRKSDLVKKGVLERYVLGSYSARKLGLQTTANAGGVHNLRVDSHNLGLDDLLKKMDTGFYATELIGQGINMVTGDYSRGAAGFWVEGGEIKYPVAEITVAGNLRDIFKNVQAIGHDIDTRGNIQTGSWLINDLMIAGD
ncbi:MAG TPA: metalloprotease PmbA [Chromatiales bacterium]|nr:metalloprotease PmbA [Thiotrichales bacterium]HIP69750.1 metalloprotease PmbA [Chromatiales bacterium]